ncbi:hypothetical protein GCM10009716_00910 [Streptomyces sodiiphilus]|uniref:Uncharacterized protein n=1 Tax=Streptomyces sodiiphilus TaxID=226217 RepID=A0ABP4ZZW8_9ACTN
MAVVTGTPAGSPSSVATSAGPCDSPAVSQRNLLNGAPRIPDGSDILIFACPPDTPQPRPGSGRLRVPGCQAGRAASAR